MKTTLVNHSLEWNRMDWSHWRMAFELALENGWDPAGVSRYGSQPAPLDRDLAEQYLAHRGHIVTAEDASNMAEALEAADANRHPTPPALIDLAEYLRRGEFGIF